MTPHGKHSRKAAKACRRKHAGDLVLCLPCRQLPVDTRVSERLCPSQGQ